VNKRTFCANTTLAAGIFIFLGGIAHTALGLPDLNEAIARGDIGAPVAGGMQIAWTFAGLAMDVLGILVILFSAEVRKGLRAGWVKAMIVGALFLLFGIAAYAYSYPNPHFLSFIAVGVLLYLPLAVYYRHFGERC
jgi:hypothetical protein